MLTPLCAACWLRFGDFAPPEEEEGSSELWAAVREREDGAVLALARETHSGRTLLLASTHLFWNPAHPDVKAVQAHCLCQQVCTDCAHRPEKSKVEPETDLRSRK